MEDELRLEDLETEFECTLLDLETNEKNLQRKLNQKQRQNHGSMRLLEQLSSIKANIENYESTRPPKYYSAQVEQMEDNLAQSEKDFFQWVKWRKQNESQNESQTIQTNNFHLVKKLDAAMEKALHARKNKSVEEARIQCVNEIKLFVDKIYQILR